MSPSPIRHSGCPSNTFHRRYLAAHILRREEGHYCLHRTGYYFFADVIDHLIGKGKIVCTAISPAAELQVLHNNSGGSALAGFTTRRRKSNIMRSAVMLHRKREPKLPFFTLLILPNEVEVADPVILQFGGQISSNMIWPEQLRFQSIFH
jgi:hypothetical protein